MGSEQDFHYPNLHNAAEAAAKPFEINRPDSMNLRITTIPLLVLGLIYPLLQSQAASPTESDESDLSRKVVDPTASLMTLGFKFSHVDGFHGRIDQSANQLQIQPVIPFEAFGVPNIMRITATHNLDGPKGSGFNDIAIFNLFVINEAWGRWGFGPVVDLIPDPLPGGDHLTAGPAIGAVLSQGQWTYGIFNQNFIGSSTELSSIQPVIAYQLGNGYSLSAGEAQFTYDWRSGEWINLPAGVALNKVTAIKGQPIKLTINPEYNFSDFRGTSQFTLRLGLSLIF